jgi:hypothetical protein
MSAKRIETMNKQLIGITSLLLLAPWLANAGIFAPAPGQTNSTAVPASDSDIDAWATGYKDYQPGLEADSQFRTPAKSLGVPGNSNGANEGTIYDIVSLGRGGSITITFSRPIFNGPGYDFAVFENSFNDVFLEFARVSVSSDGQNFATFPALSTVASSVGGFGSVDTTDVAQVAGKYRAGYGTPFDLQKLAGASIDLNDIRYVRLDDIVGDGSAPNDLTPASLAQFLGVSQSSLPSVLVTIANNAPAAIYDVYPTLDSAGFDLDAVAALNAGAIPVDLDIDSFDANNEIDPASTGNIPITVFTTSIADGDAIDFDASDIDSASLRLGYGAASINGGPYYGDYDSDGDVDSGYSFQTQDTGIACADEEMSLVGQTTSAEPIAGLDFVVTPACDAASCHP